MGAVGALVMAGMRGRLKDLGMLRRAVDQTAQLTSFVIFILIGATVFSFTFNAVDGHVWVEHLFAGLPGGHLGFLVAVNLLVFVLGCFLDQIAILILTVPVVLPLVIQLGYDPIWFGVVVIVMAEIGLVTPPVGINVFVVSRYTGVPVEDVFIGVTPHVIAHLAAIALLVLFPALVLWLPSTM